MHISAIRQPHRHPVRVFQSIQATTPCPRVAYKDLSILIKFHRRRKVSSVTTLIGCRATRPDNGRWLEQAGKDRSLKHDACRQHRCCLKQIAAIFNQPSPANTYHEVGMRIMMSSVILFGLPSCYPPNTHGARISLYPPTQWQRDPDSRPPYYVYIR